MGYSPKRYVTFQNFQSTPHNWNFLQVGDIFWDQTFHSQFSDSTSAMIAKSLSVCLYVCHPKRYEDLRGFFFLSLHVDKKN